MAVELDALGREGRLAEENPSAVDWRMFVSFFSRVGFTSMSSARAFSPRDRPSCCDQVQNLASELRWIAPWHAALLEGHGHEDSSKPTPPK
jgi:hypothetical protein